MMKGINKVDVDERQVKKCYYSNSSINIYKLSFGVYVYMELHT